MHNTKQSNEPCFQVIVPATYLQNPPTVPDSGDDGPSAGISGGSKPVDVALRLNILNIDKIDTVHMMFAVTMEANFEWRDHRLRYKNLREGLGQNHLTTEASE